MDAVRSLAPDTPQGPLLIPPGEKLKKHLKIAREKVKDLREETAIVAKGLADKLGMPATLVPRIVMAIREMSLEEWELFRQLNRAREQEIVFEQHSSADLTDSE